LTRLIPAIFLLSILTASVRAAEPQQLDASPALFSLMAALNAAGYDADLNSAANSPLRAMVRREIAAQNPASLPALKQFFAEHRQRDWTAELGQYLTLGLCLGYPPEFAWRYKEVELPPQATALSGFRDLLVRFHKEANRDELWKKAQPAFEAAIARYHAPATAALTQVNAYLRSSTSGPLGTRFQIYVDLLGAPNQIQTRSFKNDYFVVVTPSPEPQADDVRHAYLHYMLDPLAIRYAPELEKKKALGEFAQPAPLLESYFKSDFQMLATECLIKAIEARLGPAGRRQAAVDQAFREGYILTPAFFELLPLYEKSEQSLRFYYPDLVSGIDLRKEDQRLETVEFATVAPVRKAKLAEAPVELSPAQKSMEEAEQQLYTNRDLEKAKTLYLQVVNQPREKQLHARAYYGLARIAALQRDPETAEKLFQKALESSPEPQTAAWAHVYLGRLADAAGQREQALEHYRAALAVGGASEAARNAAQKGIEQAFKR
jgi:tetratricopeptide (TPR) repeat protein